MAEDEISLNAAIERMVALYIEQKHDLEIHMDGITKYIGRHPGLVGNNKQIVHSFKSRLKNEDHLREKIKRKLAENVEINEKNIFEKITDLAGVRILHLFQEDFKNIHEIIMKKISSGDWVLGEKPKVYTWDPEAVQFFKNFDLEVSEKSSSYTSVHYLIRPKQGSPICCEVQVRTLFEEIWGEVDHQINYPIKTTSVALREQILVLSKIVGAGSRLLDSLRRVEKAN